MLVHGAYEKAKLYIEMHSKEKEELDKKKNKIEPGPTITISRQTGAAAGKISDLIIDILKSKCTKCRREWAVFDKNIIEKIIEDHNLPKRLSNFLSEEKHSFLNSMMNELFGIHPSPIKLVHKTAKTILQLAEIGNVIIIGRAANIITRKMPNTYHVRIIAPLYIRINNVREYFNIDKDEAIKFIEREDKKRKEYVEHYYSKNIADPTLYDLVINAEKHQPEEIAQIISRAVMIKLKDYFI